MPRFELVRKFGQGVKVYSTDYRRDIHNDETAPVYGEFKSVALEARKDGQEIAASELVGSVNLGWLIKLANIKWFFRLSRYKSYCLIGSNAW